MNITLEKSIKILFIILLVTTNYLFADITDSLKSRLDETRGKERINILISLMERLERNEPEESINYSNEALRLLDINPDKELEAITLYHKGWAYYYLNKSDSANYYADLIGKISGEAEYDEGLAMSSLLKARIKRTEGLYKEALEYLDIAAEKNEKTGNAKLEVKILNEYGSVLRRLNRYDEATEKHKKALELFSEVDDEEELTTTYTYLGIISDLKGKYDEALNYHHKALELNKKDNDARGIAASNHNLGILYQKIDKYDQALEYYNNALRYWEEAGNKDALASTLNSIGAVNELRGNYPEALKYYERALKIWQETGRESSESIALNNLGSVHSYLGNYALSVDYLEKAIKIREYLQDNDGKAGAMIVLGDVYNKMGQTETAIATVKKAISLAEKVGNLRTLREGHGVLSDIYDSNGLYKEALAEFKKYEAFDDSLFNIESQENFAELQEKYKSEEQKQQIELLQKENEIQSLYRTVLISGIVLLIIISILLFNRYRLKQKAANLRIEAAENKAAILRVEFEQKKKELDAARDLQLSMLPAKLPQHPKVDISAFMLTATEVGGDYYDFNFSDDGTLTIALGDATGHGAQAGIMVTAVKSLFNLLSDEKDISEILNRSTLAIKKMNFTNIFMALGLVRFRNNTLELTGAGLPPAYIYRSSNGEVEEIPLKGLPLGSSLDFNYKKLSVTLNKGDVVALMSDGFPELFNGKNEMLGFEKIPGLLKEAGNKSPEEIINHFTAVASEWLNGTRQQDDMTFVVLKVK